MTILVDSSSLRPLWHPATDGGICHEHRLELPLDAGLASRHATGSPADVVRPAPLAVPAGAARGARDLELRFHVAIQQQQPGVREPELAGPRTQQLRGRRQLGRQVRPRLLGLRRGQRDPQRPGVHARVNKEEALPHTSRHLGVGQLRLLTI